jgi:beta-phosphoglucomutase-like phosphatase (HAD superfamily)
MPSAGQGAPLTLPGRFRAAVFDLDGVLVDSEPLWVEAETDLLARHGHRLTPADARATHGRSIEDTVRAYARLLSTDPLPLRAELMGLMRAHYLDGIPVRRGAPELVRSLQGRMALAVASNTDTDLVRLALDHAGLLDAFAAVVSSRDVGRAKPYPDVYLAACRALDVAPRDALAFEDSPAGVRSAKAAGMTCVGVPDREDVDLAAAGADVVVRSLAELTAVVDGGYTAR